MDLCELLRAELDGLGNDLLASEVTQLQKISSFTENIQAKLDRLYAHKFPKSCSTCGRVYETRQEYLSATRNLKGGGAVVNRLGVQEYRNCECGSTLLVRTNDRRDNSVFGQARRDLFEACLDKLKVLSVEDEATLRERLRQIFNKVAARVEAREPAE